VSKIAIDERTKRQQLKDMRNLLFEQFLKTPLDIRLALEIKLLDDQVAEYTDQIRHKRKTDESAPRAFHTN
jgi:hypothetical protein